MIRILELLIIIVLPGLMLTRIICRYLKNRQAKTEQRIKLAMSAVEKALASNSRFEIENALILYGDFLDAKTRKSVQFRANELMLNEVVNIP